MADSIVEGTSNLLAQRGSDDLRECDLVMKGGITSGVVYPSAVLALKEGGYRFRSIGGASAGAIAAAATAAAEYGRESAGFEHLANLQEELTTEGLIVRLFQPLKKLGQLSNSCSVFRAKRGGSRRS